MAFTIKELPFPDELANTDYSLVLNDNGVSEDGSPIESFRTSGKCIFSEKAKRIIDSEGKQITLLGKVIVKGDIAPSLKSVSDGVITINGCSYEIHSGARPRNPNGTIHHTMFEIK
jgi:hypothetical protein